MNPPIVMASTYHAGGDVGYGRYGNPTWEMFETASARSKVALRRRTPSGMAAVAAVLDLVPDGGTVVTSPDAYYGTLAMLERLQTRGRLTVRQVDLTDNDCGGRGTVRSRPALGREPDEPVAAPGRPGDVAGESPGGGVCRRSSTTRSTPRSLRGRWRWAPTVVVHSATKYLSGHSDLLMGVAVARDAAVVERLVSYRSLQGAVPGSIEAWLALRGLRTLHLRMERAQASAAVLADRLAGTRGSRPCTIPVAVRWSASS